MNRSSRQFFYETIEDKSHYDTRRESLHRVAAAVLFSPIGKLKDLRPLKGPRYIPPRSRLMDVLSRISSLARALRELSKFSLKNLAEVSSA